MAVASRQDRVRLVQRGDIDQVQEQARALQVLQEAVTESAPSAAPSISPGMSAMTKLRCWSTRHAQVG